MKKILLAIFAAAFLMFAAAARAQPAPARDSEGFEPVDGNMMTRGESIPAARLVAGAYGFILASLVVWIGSVAMRARRVEEELDDLRRKLDKLER